MSGAYCTHTRGALKAEILAALADGPLSTAKLAAAIGYTHERSALCTTLGFHEKRGTVASAPWVGREKLWGLPGAEFPQTAPRAAPPPKPTKPRRAIAQDKLALPAADKPIERPAPAKPCAGESVDEWMARTGQRPEVLPAPTFEPRHGAAPAHRGMR